MLSSLSWFRTYVCFPIPQFFILKLPSPPLKIVPYLGNKFIFLYEGCRVRQQQENTFLYPWYQLSTFTFLLNSAFRLSKFLESAADGRARTHIGCTHDRNKVLILNRCHHSRVFKRGIQAHRERLPPTLAQRRDVIPIIKTALLRLSLWRILMTSTNRTRRKKHSHKMDASFFFVEPTGSTRNAM